MANQLLLRQRHAIKNALTESVAAIADDATQRELLDLGYLRAENGRLIVTITGHLRYLSTLPSRFE